MFLWTLLIHDALAVPPAQAFRAYDDEHFYLYSQSSNAGFSCLIELDSVSQLVDGLKAKSEAGELPIAVKDSLPSFGIKYVRLTDALEFNRPTLTLSIKDGTPLPNPDAVRAGMDQIFTGFNQQIEGAIGVAQGLIHEFLISRHDVIQDVQFKTTKDGYTATFAMEGGTTTTVFDGQTKRSEIRMASGVIQAEAHYKKGMGDKLILSGADVVQPNGAIRMAFFSQTVDGMVLPAGIEISAAQKDSTPDSKPDLKLRFYNCSVE